MPEQYGVTLTPSCLLSKWGFNDGDILTDFYIWCEDQDRNITLTCDPHELLIKAVRAKLLPALDQDITVEEIMTIHNPIRARTVDGHNVEDCWYSFTTTPALTPSGVFVSYDELLELDASR